MFVYQMRQNNVETECRGERQTFSCTKVFNKEN